MDILSCPRCGSEMAPGQLLESTGLRFLPNETHRSFFSFNSGLITIEAFMCLICGHIEMRGDVSKLHQDLGK